jgi:hypothetical protein
VMSRRVLRNLGHSVPVRGLRGEHPESPGREFFPGLRSPGPDPRQLPTHAGGWGGERDHRLDVGRVAHGALARRGHTERGGLRAIQTRPCSVSLLHKWTIQRLSAEIPLAEVQEIMSQLIPGV